ncbi:hypothetical protein [Oceaniferula spumae]
MTERLHLPDRESCPFLPPADRVLGPGDSKRRRGEDDYFLTCLTCAQSLWLQGKPAQALLQLNHALSLDTETFTPWPLPYQAKVWLFTRRHEEGFLGNPVRHYQHLASRMSGPNSELRSWRAWVCFHLAESLLPADEFPRDEQQIEREGLEIPDIDQTMSNLEKLATIEEIQLIQKLL